MQGISFRNVVTSKKSSIKASCLPMRFLVSFGKYTFSVSTQGTSASGENIYPCSRLSEKSKGTGRPIRDQETVEIQQSQESTRTGDASNEFARQIWAQSDLQFVCKCAESRPIGGQQTAGIQWSVLAHWDRDKMDAISQTTFSSAFSWMKMFEFWLKINWNLFLRVQSTTFQQWFR